LTPASKVLCALDFGGVVFASFFGLLAVASIELPFVEPSTSKTCWLPLIECNFLCKRSVMCQKPLKRLKEAFGEMPSTGEKSGVNEKIHLLHTAENRVG